MTAPAVFSGVPSMWRAALFSLLGLTSALSAHGQEAGFLNRPTSQWLAELSDPQESVRRSAAFALGKTGQEAAFTVPQLLAALKDKEASVRAAAAHALGEIGPAGWREVVLALATSLSNERQPEVRRSAAFALGCYKAEAASARGTLRSALRDADASVRRNAAWALGQLGEAAGDLAISELSRVLADEDALVRRDTAAAL